MTDRYAVIGNPVAHSLSPQIHARFAAHTGQDIDYKTLFAELEAFTDTATQFFSEGGKGLNITLPFKQEAFSLADRLTPRAQVAGAVNTLIHHGDGHLEGDNTDGAGLVRDLTHNLGLSLAGMNILILGAGGAVRGVLEPLLQQNPASLTLANRTPEKAALLADEFAERGPIQRAGFAQTRDYAPFDLIINATSAGLSGDTPPLPANLFRVNASAYDMLYARDVTPFLAWAQGQGVQHCRDGFGMLVEQASESFYLWRGVRPDTAQVISALRPD